MHAHPTHRSHPYMQTAVTLKDKKGDSLAYPKAVLALPFQETSSTSGAKDDYSVVCGSGDGDAGGAPVRAGESCLLYLLGVLQACRCSRTPSIRCIALFVSATSPASVPTTYLPPASLHRIAPLQAAVHAAGHLPFGAFPRRTSSSCRRRTSLPISSSNQNSPQINTPHECAPQQDVVYYFKPSQDVTVTASLCDSSQLGAEFDARLYLLADVDNGGTLRAAACANHVCGSLPSLTVGWIGQCLGGAGLGRAR